MCSQDEQHCTCSVSVAGGRGSSGAPLRAIRALVETLNSMSERLDAMYSKLLRAQLIQMLY